MKYVKQFENYTQPNTDYYRKYIINEIKIYFMNDRDSGWESFVDNQEMGDCQSIVSSIIRLNINGIKPHFGEIKIIDATDDEYENKIYTHHWVTLNGEILEFSKGTLKDSVYWNDDYGVEEEHSIEYDSFGSK